MSKAGNPTPNKNRSITAEAAICLGLFLVALIPRVYDLDRFVTADEAKWVYRSAQFLAAFLAGDWAATSVNLTPAVTTTWLGSLGLASYYLTNQAAIGLPLVDWLASLPEFRTDLPILAATRWAMAIFTALGVVLLYRLARPLFGGSVALIGALFIALDPHTIALSRILGHDAPAAMLMVISLLLLLTGCRNIRLQKRDSEAPRRYLYFGLSGVAAGLAVLSKSPALFLIPFAGLLLLGQLWQDRGSVGVWLKPFLLWGLVAYLTFVVIWPAAWADPVGRPWAVIENGFISATDQEEADGVNYWLAPNLGPFYYLVHGAFKLSPLVTVGLGLALYALARNRRPETDHGKNAAGAWLESPFFWPVLFVVLFTIFMTLGDKRSPRYILPIFPVLAFIAAGGWVYLFQAFVHPAQSRPRSRTDRRYPIFVATLVLSATIVLLPYGPYYFSYFNPLAGGPLLAPQVVKYGWGEGLDQIGRFLQRSAPGSRVGTPYASTVAPYFEGRLLAPTDEHLDYVVLYSKQLQSGEPSPEAIYYYNAGDPVFSVGLNGLHYGDLYAGPALQAVQVPGGPLAFRPLTPYGKIGEPLAVDVVWPVDGWPPSGAVVELRPLNALSSVAPASLETASSAGGSAQVLAQSPGTATPIGGGLVVSRHTLAVPADLSRGSYALFVDDQPLGEIELRRFQPPDDLSRAGVVLFGDQIGLAGYQIYPSTDFVGLTVAWQAHKPLLPDYTVFAQILKAETNERVAGIDTQPLDGTLPTSRWVNGEVVVDEYLIAVPFAFEPGNYKVIVGLYQPETGQRLLLADGRDYWTVPWTFIRKER